MVQTRDMAEFPKPMGHLRGNDGGIGSRYFWSGRPIDRAPKFFERRRGDRPRTGGRYGGQLGGRASSFERSVTQTPTR